MKLWGRIWKDNHVLRDAVAEETSDDTRTHRIFRALEMLCLEFDLGKPIWLDVNIRDFKRHKRTRFTQDSFIEEIDFDYMEVMILEE